MKHQKTGDVMTAEVVRAVYGTPFKEVADLLVKHRISGLPVVDDDEKVIGVISETDLMLRQAGQGEQEAAPYERRRLPRPFWSSRKARVRRHKSGARTAGDLMSTPAITVQAYDTIACAARTMAMHGVERLPVVDEENRLTGIVTRRDLLQIFLRPDSEIRREVIQEVTVRAMWLPASAIDVTVHEGVVTLRGQLERSSEIPIARRMTEQVDGVVAVVDQLTARLEDSHLRPPESAPRADRRPLSHLRQPHTGLPHLLPHHDHRGGHRPPGPQGGPP